MKKYMLFMSLLMALGLIASENTSDDNYVVGQDADRSNFNNEDDDDYEGDPESDDEYDYNAEDALSKDYSDAAYDRAAQFVLGDPDATYDAYEDKFTDKQLMQIGVALIGMGEVDDEEAPPLPPRKRRVQINSSNNVNGGGGSAVDNEETPPPVPPRKTGSRAINNSTLENDLDTLDLGALTELLESLKQQVQVAGQKFIDNPELFNSESDLNFVLNGWKNIDKLSRRINELSSTASESTAESALPVVQEGQFPDEQIEMINSYRESKAPAMQCVIASFDQNGDIEESNLIKLLQKLNGQKDNYKQWGTLLDFSKEQKNKYLDAMIESYLINDGDDDGHGGLSQDQVTILRYSLYENRIAGVKTVIEKTNTKAISEDFTQEQKDAKLAQLGEMLESLEATFKELTNNYPSKIVRLGNWLGFGGGGKK